jgi:hypothetical protein
MGQHWSDYYFPTEPDSHEEAPERFKGGEREGEREREKEGGERGSKRTRDYIYDE